MKATNFCKKIPSMVLYHKTSVDSIGNMVAVWEKNASTITLNGLCLVATSGSSQMSARETASSTFTRLGRRWEWLWRRIKTMIFIRREISSIRKRCAPFKTKRVWRITTLTCWWMAMILTKIEMLGNSRDSESFLITQTLHWLILLIIGLWNMIFLLAQISWVLRSKKIKT